MDTSSEWVDLTYDNPYALSINYSFFTSFSSLCLSCNLSQAQGYIKIHRCIHNMDWQNRNHGKSILKMLRISQIKIQNASIVDPPNYVKIQSYDFTCHTFFLRLITGILYKGRGMKSWLRLSFNTVQSSLVWECYETNRKASDQQPSLFKVGQEGLSACVSNGVRPEYVTAKSSVWRRVERQHGRDYDVIHFCWYFLTLFCKHGRSRSLCNDLPIWSSPLQMLISFKYQYSKARYLALYLTPSSQDPV